MDKWENKWNRRDAKRNKRKYGMRVDNAGVRRIQADKEAKRNKKS
jgi:hypothetical protein